MSPKSNAPAVLFKGIAPERKHESDAGYDLRSKEGFTLKPQGHCVVATGLRIALPQGYSADVRPRSGLMVEGINVGLGLIDSGYRGEINVILFNHTNFYKEFPAGSRIAQLVVNRNANLTWEKADELPSSDRGEAGLGSTGMK